MVDAQTADPASAHRVMDHRVTEVSGSRLRKYSSRFTTWS